MKRNELTKDEGARHFYLENWHCNLLKYIHLTFFAVHILKYWFLNLKKES